MLIPKVDYLKCSYLIYLICFDYVFSPSVTLLTSAGSAVASYINPRYVYRDNLVVDSGDESVIHHVVNCVLDSNLYIVVNLQFDWRVIFVADIYSGQFGC